MKISQINQIKLRKLWCNSERILGVVVSTILSALLIAGPAIATCITKTPSSRETGSAINDALQSNRIVQIAHLTVDLPYNNNHSSDEDYVSTMIALLHDGMVYTWGNNMYGASETALLALLPTVLISSNHLAIIVNPRRSLNTLAMTK